MASFTNLHVPPVATCTCPRCWRSECRAPAQPAAAADPAVQRQQHLEDRQLPGDPRGAATEGGGCQTPGCKGTTGTFLSGISGGCEVQAGIHFTQFIQRHVRRKASLTCRFAFTAIQRLFSSVSSSPKLRVAVITRIYVAL